MNKTLFSASVSEDYDVLFVNLMYCLDEVVLNPCNPKICLMQERMLT